MLSTSLACMQSLQICVIYTAKYRSSMHNDKVYIAIAFAVYTRVLNVQLSTKPI